MESDRAEDLFPLPLSPTPPQFCLPLRTGVSKLIGTSFYTKSRRGWGDGLSIAIRNIRTCGAGPGTSSSLCSQQLCSVPLEDMLLPTTRRARGVPGTDSRAGVEMTTMSGPLLVMALC